MKIHMPNFMGLRWLSNAVALLFVIFGLSGTSLGQFLVVPKGVSLWREWMSNIQKEPSQTTGLRLYLTTEREILQTGPQTAQFQNGRYSFMLADGIVADTDGDLDGYTDVFEDNYPLPNPDRDDITRIPLDQDGNPTIPQDASFPPYPLILLANGDLIRIASSTTFADQGTVIDPKRGNQVVRMIGAPPSTMQRSMYFNDYSGEFYYVDPNTGYSRQFPLSLYYIEREFPNPQDASAMEREIVYGQYQVEYPTIFNRPYGRAGISVNHYLVPNGALTQGLKKPTWIIRSLSNDEKLGKPPITQSWVNGRLKFDPYLPVSITWDSLEGLASALDFIELRVFDEDGVQISYTSRMGANRLGVNINMESPMRLIYGDIRDFLGTPGPPLAFDGEIEMRYYRLANQQARADLSSVTVRVPIRLEVSYASWRLDMFPQSFANDSIAGPNADPDGDGFTNLQEYEQGTDPTSPKIALVLQPITNLSGTSATLNATTSSDGTVTISERGFVYSQTSVNPDPMIGGGGVDRIISSGTLGAFSESISGLDQGTQYSYKAYVITNEGTLYTATGVTFTTLNAPIVVTPSVSQITHTTAVLGGWVFNGGDTAVTERGVVYSPADTNDDPVIGGPDVVKVATSGGIGLFTVNVSGLSLGTTYHFKAYAINQGGVGYSSVGTFSTPSSLPVVDSPTVAGVTGNSATLGANVSSDGGSPISQRGIVYSPTLLNSDPLLGGSNVTPMPVAGDTGVFTTSVAGLNPATMYSFRGYAINSLGISYTSEIGVFTTSSVPVVSKPTSANVLAASATLGGTIDSNGGVPITQRGVVYSSSNSNPIIGAAGVTAVPTTGTSVGTFTMNISSLKSGTTYYFRPYAINSVGTAYSTVVGQFTTLSLPLVTSPTYADVTGNSATLGGNVVNDGGAPITQRGIVFSSTNPDPVIGGANVVVWSTSGTTGVFTLNAIGLSPTTGYAFKAYAMTSRGISYSELGLFITPTLATLSAPTIASINSEEAELGARVDSDGGSPITERGIIYAPTSINPNPFIGGSGVVKLPVAGTTGPFTLNVTGLNASTGYTFRAYAINGAGTAYGITSAFFTTSAKPSIASPTSSSITDTTAMLGGNVTRDNGYSITERGVVLSSTNPDPLIGGVDVLKFEEYGTTGVFSLEVENLDPDTVYSFKAYAINQGGTSYTNVATFKTLPFVLGGSSAVQWVAIEVPAATMEQNSFDDGVSAPLAMTLTEPELVKVPEFVYQKAPDEVNQPITFQIETTADFVDWAPIDQNNWQVDDLVDAVRARWKSTEVAPPERVFFRVQGDAK